MSDHLTKEQREKLRVWSNEIRSLRNPMGKQELVKGLENLSLEIELLAIEIKNNEES